MLQAHTRKAVDTDIQAISDLAMSSFGTSEGPEIVQLIGELLVDVTAQPVLSLVATVRGRVVGHVLFSKVRLEIPRQQVFAAQASPWIWSGYSRRALRSGLSPQPVGQDKADRKQ